MFLTSLKFLSIEQTYFGRSAAAGEESDKRFQQNIEYFKELTFLLSEWKTKYKNIFFFKIEPSYSKYTFNTLISYYRPKLGSNHRVNTL